MKKSGFTLIELLVTIVIISILSTLVIVNISDSTAKARDVKAKEEMKTINSALFLYYSDHNAYPPNPLPGQAMCNKLQGVAEYNIVMKMLVDGGYLAAVPQGINNAGYCYYDYGPGNNMGAMLGSVLEKIPLTMTGSAETCRPFTGANWCRNDQMSRFYCLCNPY